MRRVKRKDLAGQRFGRLEALREHPDRNRLGQTRWICRCDCGQETTVVTAHLRSGHTTSCGCRKLETMRELPELTTTHGLCRTRIYAVFLTMHARCENTNASDYHLYGGRGIKVCTKWSGAGGVLRFREDMGDPPPGMSIDRVDNDGDYEKGNCRWATPIEQANNGRRNLYITWCGQTKTLAQWVRVITGSNNKGLYERLRLRLRVMPVEQVMAPFETRVERIL